MGWPRRTWLRCVPSLDAARPRKHGNLQQRNSRNLSNLNGNWSTGCAKGKDRGISMVFSKVSTCFQDLAKSMWKGLKWYRNDECLLLSMSSSSNCMWNAHNLICLISEMHSEELRIQMMEKNRKTVMGQNVLQFFKFDFDVFILNYITYNTRCFAMQLDSMK